MKPFVRRFFFFATFLVSLAAVASARDPGACAHVRLAGGWGWTWTGTFILPTGAVPAAGVGINVCDADGNCTTAQTSSVDGNVSGPETGMGTWKLNPDCTGTAMVTIYDVSGNVSREATWFMVMDDNGKEFRGIIKSLQRGGTNIPVIVTMAGRRVSPVEEQGAQSQQSLLSLAAVASAQHGRACSLAGVAGQWGWTVTGALYSATGPAAVARVGTTTADAEGNFSATLTASTGGRVSELAMKGTWTVNPDCTGTMPLGVYDALGNLVATQTWNIVFDDNERELRAILTSVVLQPSGTSAPAVITMAGRRVSPIDE